MLSLLVEREEIAQAQEQLRTVMHDQFPERERRNITFRPRGLADQEVWTRGRYWYRPSVLQGPNVTTPRFLNWFGMLAPGTLSITVEANIPLAGRNGRVAGFFARDDSTRALYLMHSGNIGGGVSGVSGRSFRAWYGERPIPVIDPEARVRFGFVAVSVGAADPTRPARRYVESVKAFRQAVETGEIDLESPDFRHRMEKLDDFYSEPRGRRTGYRPGGIDYLSRHGEVVDALRKWRKARRLTGRQRIVKNVFIDMGVEDGSGNLLELYEVKTSSDRSAVYTAIGQLMVHGPKGCKKCLLLPNGGKMPADLADALKRNSIELLRFRLNKHDAKILDR